MKENIKVNLIENLNSNATIQCGNCWGHQEYSGDYKDRQIDLGRDQKENFIRKFVNKYIRQT